MHPCVTNQVVGAFFFLDDVQTCWNFNSLMLRSARRLGNIVHTYWQDQNDSQFNVFDIEWQKIDYLLHLTKPVSRFTQKSYIS